MSDMRDGYRPLLALTMGDASGSGPEIIAKALAEAEIRQKSGATVLAIRKADGAFNLQPLALSRIEKGDILVVIGTQEQLELLEKMVK